MPPSMCTTEVFIGKEQQWTRLKKNPTWAINTFTKNMIKKNLQVSDTVILRQWFYNLSFRPLKHPKLTETVRRRVAALYVQYWVVLYMPGTSNVMYVI